MAEQPPFRGPARRADLSDEDEDDTDEELEEDHEEAGWDVHSSHEEEASSYEEISEYEYEEYTDYDDPAGDDDGDVERDGEDQQKIDNQQNQQHREGQGLREDQQSVKEQSTEEKTSTQNQDLERSNQQVEELQDRQQEKISQKTDETRELDLTARSPDKIEVVRSIHHAIPTHQQNQNHSPKTRVRSKIISKNRTKSSLARAPKISCPNPEDENNINNAHQPKVDPTGENPLPLLAIPFSTTPSPRSKPLSPKQKPSSPKNPSVNTLPTSSPDPSTQSDSIDDTIDNNNTIKVKKVITNQSEDSHTISESSEVEKGFGFMKMGKAEKPKNRRNTKDRPRSGLQRLGRNLETTSFKNPSNLNTSQKLAHAWQPSASRPLSTPARNLIDPFSNRLELSRSKRFAKNAKVSTSNSQQESETPGPIMDVPPPPNMDIPLLVIEKSTSSRSPSKSPNKGHPPIGLKLEPPHSSHHHDDIISTPKPYNPASPQETLLIRLVVKERDYIHLLMTGIQMYREYLALKEEKLMAQCGKLLFSNIDEIFYTQQIVWNELENALGSFPNVDIGKLFNNTIVPACNMYLEFIPNIPMALACLESLKKRFKGLPTILKWVEERNEIPPLSSLLTLPSSRLKEYSTFLEDLLHYVPYNSEERLELVSSVNKSEELLKTIKSLELEKENEIRVMEVASSLNDYTGEDLVRLGRQFIAEGGLSVYNECDTALTAKQPPVAIADYIFVFNDLIVYTKVKKPINLKSFVGKIWMHRSNIADYRDNSIVKNAFKITHGNEKLLFVTNTPAEKAEWMWDLNHFIRESIRTKRVFGVALVNLMSREEEEKNDIPSILKNTTKYILDNALRLTGIFRESGRSSEVQGLKDQYDLGQDVNLTDHDPHAVSNVIKLWFRELPHPIVPWEMFQTFRSINESSEFKEDPERKEETLLAEMKLHVSLMARYSKNVLQHIMNCLREISFHSDENKMIPNNIGIVFGPNCVRPPDHSDDFDTAENQQKIEIVAFFLTHYHSLFHDVETERIEYRTRAYSALKPPPPLQMKQNLSPQLVLLPTSRSFSPLFTKSGFLKKKGKRLWNMYWFVVRYKALLWFRKPEDDRPKNWLNLQACTVERSSSRPLGLEILTKNPERPIHVMLAQTEGEREQWYRAIWCCIEQTLPEIASSIIDYE